MHRSQGENRWHCHSAPSSPLRMVGTGINCNLHRQGLISKTRRSEGSRVSLQWRWWSHVLRTCQRKPSCQSQRWAPGASCTSRNTTDTTIPEASTTPKNLYKSPSLNRKSIAELLNFHRPIIAIPIIHCKAFRLICVLMRNNLFICLPSHLILGFLKSYYQVTSSYFVSHSERWLRISKCLKWRLHQTTGDFLFF